MTDKLRISGAAGILAFVPHALGEHPKDSIVLITMRGRTLGATLRIDAPALVPPLDFAQRVTTYLLADEEATNTLMVVYSDEPGAEGKPPFHEYTEALIQELETAKMPLKDAWLVTSNHWGNLLCDDTGCCPNEPLEAITNDAANTELIYRGSRPEFIAPAPFTGDPSQAGIIAGMIPAGTPAEMTTALGTWHTALASDTAPDRSDALTLLAAFGHGMIRDFMFTAVIEDDHAAMGDVFMGQLSKAPDWARVDRAQELGHQLLTEAPTGHRAAVLCMIGWLHWYKGSSSFAVKFIELAKADDPGYRLAELLLQVIDRGTVAPVAVNKDTAYKKHLPDA
jgi:hypothetical protein